MGGSSGERERHPDVPQAAIDAPPAAGTPPGQGAGPEAQPPPSTQHPYHRWLVPLLVGGTFLFFVVVVGLLYYNWIVARPPSAFIVVEYDANLIGAEVTVDGLSLMEPYQATLEDGEHHRVPFYLRPGSYTVTLTRDDRVIAETEVDLVAREGKRWNLRTLLPDEPEPTDRP